MDDTPGKERVHLAHKIGTFTETGPDGTTVTHTVKDNYHVIMGSDFVSIEGVCNVTVNGDCNLKVVKNLNIEASAVNISATGDIRMKAGGKVMTESGGATHVKSKAAVNIGAGGKLSLKGKNTVIQGNSLQLAGLPANKVKIPHGVGKIIPQGVASSPSDTGLKSPS